MSAPDSTAAAARFRADLQADIRRERQLLYAEIVILVLLAGLVLLRYWIGQ
ncbi:hypothetical protein AB4Y64_07205 [Lysobacter sp. TAF61]|uniref:hypothetical protein n=1 Tax=Lysobacter sp. TAF61 TaxID=3233072 RepID=UPI003F98B083